MSVRPRTGPACTALALMMILLPATAFAVDNDERDAAIALPLGKTVPATNATATEDASDPLCGSSGIFKTIWFSHQAQHTEQLVISVSPSGEVDAEVAVLEFIGGTANVVACEDHAWEGDPENVRFSAEAGASYLFVVGNAGPDQMGGDLQVDLHRPVRLAPRLDGSTWAKSPQGYVVVTGRVRCSRSARIALWVTIAQSRSDITVRAEGGKDVRCRSTSHRPWSISVVPFTEGSFGKGTATVRLRAEHDADEVLARRSQQAEVVSCTRIGTLRADDLGGTGGNDRICGLYGNDDLFGGTGNDVLVGFAGRDRLLGSRGRDVLLGGDGPDQLMGGPGSDLCRGGRDRDRTWSCERG